MSTKSIASDAFDIGAAINRSVNYDELVTVTLAEGVTIARALVWVSRCSESHQSTPIDRDETGTRREDVWGDDGQGGEFRLFLVEGNT